MVGLFDEALVLSATFLFLLVVTLVSIRYQVTSRQASWERICTRNEEG